MRTYIRRLNKHWLKYEYKHTTIAIVSVAAFIFLFDSAFLAAAFSLVVKLEYLGAFVAGMLAASFFTASPAVALVTQFATSGQLDPLLLAIFIGAGSAVGDLLLLLFFEEQVFYELRPLLRRLKIARFARRSKRRSAPLLLLGAFIIVTPLPDEIGLGLLGISRFPKVFIFVVCLALNTLGAALFVLAARALSA